MIERRKLLRTAVSASAIFVLPLMASPLALATDTSGDEASDKTKLTVTEDELRAMGFDPDSLVEYQALDREYYPCWAVVDADLANASVTRGDSAELQKDGVVDPDLPLAIGHYVIFRWDMSEVIAVVRPE
ncbi:MAG: hypothetical protein CMF26_00095 [Kiloniella sp.]|nr:hypothetical protein [Kiloniella sp.]